MVFLFGALFSGKASKMFPSVVMIFSEKDEENNNNINAIDSLQEPPKIKKKRNLPGNPDPDAEVIALSPKTLLATNRFECEICQKGFQRDQNLQLHRRGHNLPWKLKQTNSSVIRKRAYVCPEPTCVHHHPSRALGDLTGIKKHFCRKHGEKKWKCEKCSKIYAVQSDWKAHSKTCGTREYRCDCGTLFSRKDNFTTHRAFCVALAKETARISANAFNYLPPLPPHTHTQTQPPLFPLLPQPPHQCMSSSDPNPMWDPLTPNPLRIKPENLHLPIPPPPPHPSAAYYETPPPTAQLSATTLLQKAASFGSHPVGHVTSSMASSGVTPELMGSRVNDTTMWPKGGHHLTRDFLGLTKEECGQLVLNVAADANMQMRDTLLLTRVLEDCEFVAEPTWG